MQEARKKAFDAQTLIHKGLDSLAERLKAEAHRKKHEAICFLDITKRYMASHQDAWTNAKHAYNWASSLECYGDPILDQKPQSELTTEDLLEVLEPIWRDKNETAKKIQCRIKLVFSYARTGQLYFVEKPAIWQDHLSQHFACCSHRLPIKHHRALPCPQMPAFYDKILQVKTMVSQALRFTILTAARTSEVLGTRTDKFNLGKLIWRVPAERMKARKPNGVLLSEAAATLIEAASRAHKPRSSSRAGIMKNHYQTLRCCHLLRRN